MSEDPCLTDENLQRSSLLMQEPSIDLAVVGLPHNLMKSSKPTLDARTLGGCGGESGKSRTHSEVEFWLDGAAAKGLASRGSVETSEGSFCLPKCLAGGVEASSPKPLAVGTNIVEGPAAGRNMDEGEEKIKAGGQGDLRSKDRKFTKGDSSSLSNESLVGIKGVDPPIRPSPRMSFSSDGVLRGDSPDELVEQQLLEEAQEKSKQEFTRFSLSDIADNPELAKAAKMELTGKKSEGDAASVVESMCDVASRITDLERVRFTAGSADRDAEREGQAGSEEVTVLLKRLDVGKRSVMNLIKLVMKFHQAEAAYSRSLLAISRINISSIGSSEGYKVAADGIAELPMVIGGAHSQISHSLLECEAKLKSVLGRFKVVSDELTLMSQKVNTVLTDKRGALSKAIVGHENACRVTDPDCGKPPPGGKSDPWLTEGKLAQGHTDLLQAQYTFRTFLASAFSHVRDAETFRLQVTKHVMESLMHTYGSAVMKLILPYTTNLEKVVNVLDPDQEILDLMATADSHGSAANSLEVLHAEEESLRCGDLFSSPDIVRQGTLEVRESGSPHWYPSHFVLTQAGFLYWFSGKKPGSVPTDSINLAKSSFAGGDPPEFKILEGTQGLFGSKRTIVFKAATIEDCCEWAISIRETLAEVKQQRKKKTGKLARTTTGVSYPSNYSERL